MPLKPSVVSPLGDRHPEVRVDDYKKIQPNQITESEAFSSREFTTDLKQNFEYIADNNLHHRYMDDAVNNQYIGAKSVNSRGGICRDIGVSSMFGDSNSTNYMYQKFNREILPVDRVANGRTASNVPTYTGRVANGMVQQPNIQMAQIDERNYNQGGLASQIASTIAQLAASSSIAPSLAPNSGPQVPGRSPMRTSVVPDSMRQNKQGLFVPGAQFQQQTQVAHRNAPAQNEQAVIDQLRRNRESIMERIHTSGKTNNKNTSENDYEEI